MMPQKRRTYGWQNIPEDKRRCIADVHDGGRSVSFHQCFRKRGHGRDGLFCKQHAKHESRYP